MSIWGHVEEELPQAPGLSFLCYREISAQLGQCQRRVSVQWLLQRVPLLITQCGCLLCPDQLSFGGWVVKALWPLWWSTFACGHLCGDWGAGEETEAECWSMTRCWKGSPCDKCVFKGLGISAIGLILIKFLFIKDLGYIMKRNNFSHRKIVWHLHSSCECTWNSYFILFPK